MEVPLYLISLLIIFGSYAAFLSAIIDSLSQERLNEILSINDKRSRTLKRLKLRGEESVNSFILLEFATYFVVALLAGATAVAYFEKFYYLAYSFLILFPVIAALRTIFHAAGRRFADNLALRASPQLKFFSALTLPFVSLAHFLDLKLGGADKEEASRDEIAALFETAREEGSLEPGEYRILKNMMLFSSVPVSDVMTPRTVIFSCRADSTVGKALDMPELQMYSRFPIWEGDSIDKGIIGYVMSKDVLSAGLNGMSSIKLREFARDAYFIPESVELDAALEEFLRRRNHMFVVVDEYGGVEGLITMEDVLETMLGAEIVDEADKVVDLRAFAKEKRDRRVANKIVKTEA